MKIRIEYRDLVSMGANDEQLNTYSNTYPFSIFKTDENTYITTGVVECETDAQGILDLLTELANPDC